MSLPIGVVTFAFSDTESGLGMIEHLDRQLYRSDDEADREEEGQKIAGAQSPPNLERDANIDHGHGDETDENLR